MSTTTHESESYLSAVREHLADLNEEERADLLGDLAQHLREVDSEEGAASLRERLGDPADYAAELRTAAGLAPRATSTATESRPRANASVIISGAREGARQLLVDLRPAWWVLRGAVLVALPFWLGGDPDDNFPVPGPGGSHGLGIVIMLIGAALSVWLGHSADQPHWRRTGLAANVVFFLALVTGSLLPVDGIASQSVEFIPQPPQSEGLVSNHGPVTNIYPYDAQGHPLEGVLLYDQDGRPLRVARQEWWPDGCQREPVYPLAADGVPVEFSYPFNYAVSLDVFGRPAPESELQQYREMFEQRCTAQIPRPDVPIPTFPTAPTATTQPTP